jgi:hypothetical protein
MPVGEPNGNAPLTAAGGDDADGTAPGIAAMPCALVRGPSARLRDPFDQVVYDLAHRVGASLR